MNRRSRTELSLAALAKHQERIKNMVSRINSYQPKFHVNKHYKKYNINKMIERRQQQSERLFEENMIIIQNLESTPAKVQTKKFPKVKPNPNRMKTLSMDAYKRKTSSTAHTKIKPKNNVIDPFRNNEELFQKNIKLITEIESTGPKIKCWTSKRTYKINEMLKNKKREEGSQIIHKFKDIGKELRKMRKSSFSNHSSQYNSSKSIRMK